MPFFVFISIIISLLNFNIYAQELIYNDTNLNITEIFRHVEHGFIYEKITEKKTTKFIIETNVNGASIGITNISDEKHQTNEFFIVGGKLITPVKSIEIGYLEVLPFAEIQLQNFITNPSEKEISYVTIRTENLEPSIVTAKKLPINNKNSSLIEVEITINGVSSKFVRFLYLFDKEGIALKKQGFFGFSKDPKFTLILQEKNNSR